jgi:hypothetical protein
MIPYNNSLGVCEARLHVIAGQIRMGSKQLVDIRVMCKFFPHQIHGDACPLHNWLLRQNPWVCDDSLLVKSVIFFHTCRYGHCLTYIFPLESMERLLQGRHLDNVPRELTLPARPDKDRVLDVIAGV